MQMCLVYSLALWHQNKQENKDKEQGQVNQA